MKTRTLSVALLLALATLAPAADPNDVLWEKMFELMYDLPKSPKDTRLERLKALIEEGADVNDAIGFESLLRVGETRADRKGTAWPLDVAVQQAQVEMVELLLAKGAKCHGQEMAQAAFARIPKHSLAMVTALLKAGADVNSRDEYGHTALLWASYRGNKDLVTLLLTQPGIKVDQTNVDGDTALMAAAENGHTEVVEMLLKAGADVRFTNEHGETAVTRAEKTLAKQQAILSKLQSSSK
jgi:hypothetical protein